jgi:hypothetical protein
MACNKIEGADRDDDRGVDEVPEQGEPPPRWTREGSHADGVGDFANMSYVWPSYFNFFGRKSRSMKGVTKTTRILNPLGLISYGLKSVMVSR